MDQFWLGALSSGVICGLIILVMYRMRPPMPPQPPQSLAQKDNQRVYEEEISLRPRVLRPRISRKTQRGKPIGGNEEIQ